MKKDKSYEVYDAMGIDFPASKLINKNVKAVIITLNGKDIVVENDNYGTRRKYPDFTKGKKKAGLNPLQIVFTDLKSAMIFKTKYIGSDDQIHVFGEGEEVLNEIKSNSNQNL